MAPRPGPGGPRRRLLDPARGGAGAARRAAQRHPRRPVRRAAAAARGPDPARPGAGPPRVRPGRRAPRAPATRGRWCWPRPTWAATPTGSGGCWPTAPRRRPGLGYAMENRRVLSRVQPELYRAAGLHRMEPFFSALRSALLQSAPGDLADPRVVVLSPGHALRDGLRPVVHRLGARVPARAGQRPRGARGLGADAGLRPPRAGRRHPASRRRSLERPAGAARRLPARVSPVSSRPCAAVASASSTGSAPVSWRTPPCCR